MCKCRATTAAARSAAEKTAASIPGPPPVSTPNTVVPPATRPTPVNRRVYVPNGRIYLNHWGRRISAPLAPPPQPKPRTQVTPPQLRTFLSNYAKY